MVEVMVLVIVMVEWWWYGDKGEMLPFPCYRLWLEHSLLQFRWWLWFSSGSFNDFHEDHGTCCPHHTMPFLMVMMVLLPIMLALLKIELQISSSLQWIETGSNVKKATRAFNASLAGERPFHHLLAKVSGAFVPNLVQPECNTRSGGARHQIWHCCKWISNFDSHKQEAAIMSYADSVDYPQ